MSDDPRFNGFPPGAFKFFEELGRHNERDWFRAHQEQEERDVASR